MSVKIQIPEKRQDTSIGRRLFAMAAPIVGGALGGPAGAMAGSLIGNKLSGASTQDAILGAAQQGIGAAGKSEAPQAVAPTASAQVLGQPLPQLEKPDLGDSAFGRRLNAVSQNPQVALQEGLNTLSILPQDHPFRKQYTEPLVKASYLASGRK